MKWWTESAIRKKCDRTKRVQTNLLPLASLFVQLHTAFDRALHTLLLAEAVRLCWCAESCVVTLTTCCATLQTAALRCTRT